MFLSDIYKDSSTVLRSNSVAGEENIREVDDICRVALFIAVNFNSSICFEDLLDFNIVVYSKIINASSIIGQGQFL